MYVGTVKTPSTFPTNSIEREREGGREGGKEIPGLDVT